MKSYITTVVLIALMLLDVYSVYEIYQSSKKHFDTFTIPNLEYDQKRSLSHCLQIAVDYELSSRTAMPETNFQYDFRPYPKDDTTHYTTKTIETMDTTFQVRIRKEDSRAIAQIRQYILKETNPIDLTNLEKPLVSCLKNNRVNTRAFYFAYIDMKGNKEIKHHPQMEKPANFLASDTIPIDILGSVGVCAHINKNHPDFWETNKREITRNMIYAGAGFILLLILFIFRKKLNQVLF